MKRLLLGLALAFVGSSANAAGLYLSAGYGKSDPDFNISELSSASKECWDDVNEQWKPACAYGSEYEYIPGFPTGKVLANYDPTTGVGLQADDFNANLPSNYDFTVKDGKTMAFAVGWDISQNPFRFEFEYQKTDFKSPGYNLVINTGPIVVYQGMYEDSDAANAAGYPGSPTADDGSAAATDYADDGNNCANGICINKNEFSGSSNPSKYSYIDFDGTFYQDMTASVSAYMGNVYFEIPGFGSIDPYVGYGFGVAKMDYDLYVPTRDPSTGAINGGDIVSFTSAYEDASQLIAGVEYRFDETPVIVGVEYRQFKATFEDDEGAKDEFKHKYFMFKLRYDFISDEF